MRKFRITRSNRSLEVEVEKNGFVMTLTKYKSSYSIFSGSPVETVFTVRQSQQEQIWELVDALTQPDVLHPVYRDIHIRPFGDEGKFWLHVKWEGWHSDEIEDRFSGDPDIKELLSVVIHLKERAEQIEKDIYTYANNNSDPQLKLELTRKVAQLLASSIATLIPENPYPQRALFSTPFRKLTLGTFNSTSSISIRLSPSEARRFARVIQSAIQQ